jgi:hypothetical protein
MHETAATMLPTAENSAWRDLWDGRSCSTGPAPRSAMREDTRAERVELRAENQPPDRSAVPVGGQDPIPDAGPSAWDDARRHLGRRFAPVARTDAAAGSVRVLLDRTLADPDPGLHQPALDALGAAEPVLAGIRRTSAIVAGATRGGRRDRRTDRRRQQGGSVSVTAEPHLGRARAARRITKQAVEVATG